MEWCLGVSRWLSSLVWGPGMLLLMIGVGLWFTIRLGFLPLTRGGTILRCTVGSLFGRGRRAARGKISPFQAVSTALAGTMGTGNITGVATALVAGGPGAIFWMWVSALFGMATKYAEVLLAVEYRQLNRSGGYSGGPMYYLRDGANQRGLALLFALLCVLASFGIGNMSQVNSISQSLAHSFGVPPLATGLLCALLVAGVVIGGISRIGRVSEMVVPVASLLYIGVAVWVLCCNRRQIFPALGQIVAAAFDLRAAAGGVLGYGVLRAMRFGMARGVFSNEAGLGSAPIAHAAADTSSSVEQGFWGIFEVFVDTILCCTLTTLVILTADGGRLWQSGLDGSALTTAAFEWTLGSLAGGFVSVSMVFFALSSMLGWYFYGERCLDFLLKEKEFPLKLYKIIFLILIVVGSVTKITLVWDISDALNGLMALPNLAGLLILSPVVVTKTRQYFRRRGRKGRN